jgi:hypothetical protein
MRRALLCMIVLFSAELGPARPSAADEADLLGQRVRVDTGASAPLVGVVTHADADALRIRDDARGSEARVSRDAILVLEASRGFRRHTVRGLVGGALAWGAVVGLYAAFGSLDESGVGEPLFIGGMVAAGGLVGSLVKTERWERIPLSTVSARVGPAGRGVRAEVVLTF